MPTGPEIKPPATILAKVRKLPWKLTIIGAVALVSLAVLVLVIYTNESGWTAIVGVSATVTGLAAAGAFVLTAITTHYNYHQRQKDEKRHKTEREEDMRATAIQWAEEINTLKKQHLEAMQHEREKIKLNERYRKEDLESQKFIRAWEIVSSVKYDGAVLKRNLEYLNNEKHEPLNGLQLNGKFIEGLLLPRGKLEKVDFSESRLHRSNLKEAKLQLAQLKGTGLYGANLEGANMRGENLEGADLEKANLEEADMVKANFKGANLSFANLTEADLSEANLEGADLTGALCVETTLNGANLSGADLSQVRKVTPDKIITANGNKDTKLPDHLERPSHWLNSEAREDSEDAPSPETEQ